MLANCANPSCTNRFRYLCEGRLFSFQAQPLSEELSRNFEAKEHRWLCAQCAVTLTIHFDRETGIHVVPKTKFESGECVRVASLYQAGVQESYCNRCGRFVGASNRVRVLEVAEEAHRCQKPAA